MGTGKYMGQTESMVQAYKPVQARLSLPPFLIEGDSVSVIGKTQNYLGDSVNLKRQFALDLDTLFRQSAALYASVLDTLPIVAPRKDSLTLTYRIQDPNGYEDGERRTVEVLRKGKQRDGGKLFVPLQGHYAEPAFRSRQRSGPCTGA